MAQPLTVPRLLTVAEYLALGETEIGYTELVEGRVMTTPNPLADHNHAGLELALQLRAHLPAHLEVLLDLDVDLQLAPPDGPGFSRRPDVLVATRDARPRQRREGGAIRASEVVLVVEILSPGSRRTDNVIKRGEYADAGVPHYWILDMAEPPSLLACHLAGEFGYADGGSVTDTFTAAEPFALTINLDALR